ncbi:MAG: response regulator [Ignavibacteria bacterium]|nr:response regulator [Ignavibacteria bacterium]MBT8383884.1 response regulator [Ignavibacteria bacterium]MBT8390553.1 response regulator [Ignavibacteria bacterium]NNJ51923.1 response regulator [Ignavibacteriaceae bacterium]NNL20413.1 response regulator [Ignavibacteriaceae bacterium]
MPASIIAKYVPKDLLEDQSSPLAISDKNQKLVWFNKSFKNTIGGGRLKGVSINTLFKLPDEELNVLFNGKKHQFENIPQKGNDLKITPLPLRGKSKSSPGFLIEIIPTVENNKYSKSIALSKPLESAFQNELQSVLMMLLKENSIEAIADDISKKCAEISRSDFGVLCFLDDESISQFKYFDPNNLIESKSDSEKNIRSDFKFITKWLMLNKQPLMALNNRNNLGYNLTQSFGCDSLVISPCIFENKLLAVILNVKKNDAFSNSEINKLQQFAALLAFAITHIKTQQLNAALESRLLQAQKLETIGKLSSGMAHDFSNLLSSIFGSVNLLRKRVELKEGVNKLIDNIEDCSVRARDLTKGLLSFGKPTPKRKELVKPHQLLKEISKVVTQTFPKTITFTEEIDKELNDILGNGTEIYQILLNLCVNAKEATNNRGELKLSAKNITIDRENLVHYPLLKEGNYVCFSVSDDGEGIEEKNLTRIFDPYFSTRTKESGSGLGLYVTYGIVKAHNGYIEVSSKLREGTTFDVYIPTFEVPKEKRPGPTEAIILLADDEPMLSDLLAELLESNGYNVVKVSSGDEVLRLLTEEIKVDLAIIDYNMPGLNGIDTIEQIRKRGFDIPIILSSGSLRMENDEILDKYKINSRIEKPYEFEAMLETIKKLL